MIFCTSRETIFVRMLRGALIIGTALAVLPSCGGECGEGTVRYGDTCLAVDPFDTAPPTVAITPGLYTREVGTVRLEANEPATIYYTIDGTVPTLESPHEADTVVIPNVPDNAQLRYFAVDLNGNRSADELRIWIIDRDGPAPPLDFKLAFTNPSRSVQWTPPPDPRPGGVLLARVEGQLTSTPVSGKQYAVGDELSPGVTIVQIDGPEVTAGTFTESMNARPGLVRYVAWAFDDLYNYGGAAGAYTVVPMPAQTGVVNANGNGTFTVPTQPAHMMLSGSASLSDTTLTVEIAMRNDTTRVVFAPKLVIKSALPNGITLTNATGTFETFPYRAYGGAIQPGATARQSLTFTGAAADTALTLDVELRDNPIMFATEYDGTFAGPVIDQITGLGVLTLGAQTTGNGGDGLTHRGGITPDGRLLVGARTAGAVTAYDLVSGARVLVSELRPQKAQVPVVVLDASATTAYAIVMDGHPQNLQNNGNGSSKSELVRLDVATLTPNARLDLGVAKPRGLEISPDGKTLLIAGGTVQQGVIVVDLTTFTITNRILTDFRVNQALFVPGTIEGASIAAVGERVALYSLDGTPGPSFTTPGTAGKVVRALYASPTQLWIGRRDELSVLDTNDGTSQTFPTLDARILELYDGKLYAGTYSILRINLDGTVDLNPVPGFTNNTNGHWVGRSPF